MGMLSVSSFAPMSAHAAEIQEDVVAVEDIQAEDTASEDAEAEDAEADDIEADDLQAEDVIEIADEETPLAGGPLMEIEAGVDSEAEVSADDIDITADTKADEKADAGVDLEDENKKLIVEAADECEHVDEDKNGACDLCGKEMELKSEADEKAEIFTVTFVDGINGETIATYEVEKGADVTAPEAPVHEGYEFAAYSRELTNIVEDVAITALYQKAIVVYEVDKVTDLAGRTYDTEGNYEANQDLTVEINGETQSYTSDDTAYYTVAIDESDDFVGTITFYEEESAIDRIVIHSEGAEVSDEYIDSIRLDQVEVEAAPEKEIEAETIKIDDEETPLAGGQQETEAEEDEKPVKADAKEDASDEDSEDESDDKKAEDIEIVADDKLKVEAVTEATVPDTDGGDGDGDGDDADADEAVEAAEIETDTAVEVVEE